MKCDSKPEHIQIATAEISQKFKFFETYRPNHGEKRPFRITPPREGVVKMPTPESNAEQSTEEKQKRSFQDNVLQKTQTTSAMLNKFREMEQNKSKDSQFNGLRPLKCFTPPPEDRPRYFDRSNSEDDEDEDEDDDDDEGDEGDVNNGSLTLVAVDDALKEVGIHVLYPCIEREIELRNYKASAGVEVALSVSVFVPTKTNLSVLELSE